MVSSTMDMNFQKVPHPRPTVAVNLLSKLQLLFLFVKRWWEIRENLSSLRSDGVIDFKCLTCLKIVLLEHSKPQLQQPIKEFYEEDSSRKIVLAPQSSQKFLHRGSCEENFMILRNFLSFIGFSMCDSDRIMSIWLSNKSKIETTNIECWNVS